MPLYSGRAVRGRVRIVDQAKANMANIDAQVAAQQARIDQADKQTAQAEAALTFAQQQERRYTALVKTGAGTVEQAQQYSSNLLQAQANYAATQANKTATEKQLPVLNAQRETVQAQLEQARAALEQADANLSRTSITAPVAGRVTRLTAAKGNYAAVGQALMMFVLLRPKDDGSYKARSASAEAAAAPLFKMGKLLQNSA